jgi:hypothetical protein
MKSIRVRDGWTTVVVSSSNVSDETTTAWKDMGVLTRA